MTDADASIDDLLRHDEDAPPRQKRLTTGTGWWIRTLLMAGGMAAVAVFGLRMAGLALSIPLAYAGCLALLMLRRVVALVAAPPQPRAGIPRGAGEESGSYNWLAEQDALRVAVTRWERRLSWYESDRERFQTSVRPLLREMVDERLRQRHGFTLNSDPKRARALIGDPLWNFLTTPAKRPLAPSDLAASVSRLEKL
ncbi:hypothetical protein [Phytohabitans rumicis]|uniref:Uncharacterized protein n=1 Tax=Phytohabitans rumicis TaxID=1076125 RepID=A0A6V8KX10_9ACTN|nr:hypothetical protein [Phytohabitans rumicis]GFJ89622.1 hypothetical protein Prum_032640 [Phytohabitans rumicis]